MRQDRDISVVMPVRHAAEHIDAAVKSLLAQRLSPLEVLVVDDDARFVWLDSSVPTVSSVDRGSERLFDLETHRFRRRLDQRAGSRFDVGAESGVAGFGGGGDLLDAVALIEGPGLLIEGVSAIGQGAVWVGNPVAQDPSLHEGAVGCARLT